MCSFHFGVADLSFSEGYFAHCSCSQFEQSFEACKENYPGSNAATVSSVGADIGCIRWCLPLSPRSDDNAGTLGAEWPSQRWQSSLCALSRKTRPTQRSLWSHHDKGFGINCTPEAIEKQRPDLTGFRSNRNRFYKN